MYGIGELSKDKYHLPFSIGHGEFIFFRGNEVLLTIYNWLLSLFWDPEYPLFALQKNK